jgi:hypothetical protein
MFGVQKIPGFYFSVLVMWHLEMQVLKASFESGFLLVAVDRGIAAFRRC